MEPGQIFIVRARIFVEPSAERGYKHSKDIEELCINEAVLYVLYHIVFLVDCIVHFLIVFIILGN